MSQFFKGTTGAPSIGNVIGPASSTDNAVVRFDGATGKLIQNSVVIMDDDGNINSQGSSVGGEKSFLNQNNDNNAGSAAKMSVLVGGTSAGDAYNEWSIGAARAYSFGVDNDDSQTFKLTTDAAANVDPSSGTSLMEITSAGEISFPSATLTQYGVVRVGASGLLESTAVGTATHVLTSNGAGVAPTFQAVPSGVATVSGTANRISSTGGANPVIDIDAAYVGQASITTLGTITTGVWNGTAVTEANGGTNQTTYATGDVLYASGANTLAKLAAGADTEVLTLAAGVPSWAAPTVGTVTSVSGTANRISSTGGATPVIDIDAAYVGQTSITTLGTVATGTWEATDVEVAHGGTGLSATTAYAVLCGGTTSTAALQSIASVGTSGQVLTSNGAAALPTFQAAASGIVTADSDSGSATGSTVTWAGTNGITTTGAAATVTVTGVTATSSAIGVATFDENDFLVTAGDVTLAARTRSIPNVTENLGITYASSVLSVTGADGTALSATNPGYVTLQSKSSPGELITIEITADQGFIDDTGASEIIGNNFGTVAAVAWANAMPFYIYAVLNDDEDAIAFMISRSPGYSFSYLTTGIGTPSNAIADTQGSMFSFDNITVTEYDVNPCVMIGSIRMTKTTSDDWTVAALANTDGIGRFNEETAFAMPSGTQNASAGKYMLENGGTAPVFTTNIYTYTVDSQSGEVLGTVNLSSDGGTDGVGAVSAQIILPYLPKVGSAAPFNGTFWNVSAGSGTDLAMLQIASTNLYAFIGLEAGAFAQNGNYSAGNRSIQGTFNYKIANS